MNALPPYPNIERVVQETSADEVNKMIRDGWVLLLTFAAQDTGGGYAVFVLGKRRVTSTPNASPDLDGFDQRLG